MGYPIELSQEWLDKFNEGRSRTLHQDTYDSGCTFDVRENGRVVASLRLEDSQGLPYLISTNLWITPDRRGLEILDTFDSVKEQVVMQSGGYLGVIASVRSENAPELAHLFKTGWRQIHYRGGRHIMVKDYEKGV